MISRAGVTQISSDGEWHHESNPTLTATGVTIVQTTPLGRNPKAGVEVTKASRYRQHAEECRILVKQVPDGAQPSQLLKMDKT